MWMKDKIFENRMSADSCRCLSLMFVNNCFNRQSIKIWREKLDYVFMFINIIKLYVVRMYILMASNILFWMFIILFGAKMTVVAKHIFCQKEFMKIESIYSSICMRFKNIIELNLQRGVLCCMCVVVVVCITMMLSFSPNSIPNRVLRCSTEVVFSFWMKVIKFIQITWVIQLISLKVFIPKLVWLCMSSRILQGSKTFHSYTFWNVHSNK